MSKMPNDIKELEQRINKLKAKEASLRAQKKESEFSYASKAGFRVGTELLSGVLVGAALGYFLDMLFGTKPWLMVLFLFFGGAAGVLNVYRFVKSEDARKKE